MMSYQWTLAVVGICLAAAVVWLVRHNHLHARIATWWIVLSVVIAVVGITPGLVESIGVKLGVGFPPMLAVLVGLAVVLLNLLRIDIERSKEQQKLRILAQKVALLESELATSKKQVEYEKQA